MQHFLGKEYATKDDVPFYLYFSHYAVHAPFESDPRFAPHYQDSGKPANAQAFATLIEGMDKSLGDMLDQFEVGQKVQLNFDIRGNEYKDRYYVNLSCWKIQAAEGGDGGGAPAAAASGSSPEPSAAELRKEDDFDDDIPF